MSGGGREWSGMMEGVVWCDGGWSLMDEGWSSVVGVAGWALLSMGVIRGWGVVICGWALLSVGRWWLLVMRGCHLWVGDHRSWWRIIPPLPSHYPSHNPSALPPSLFPPFPTSLHLFPPSIPFLCLNVVNRLR